MKYLKECLEKFELLKEPAAATRKAAYLRLPNSTRLMAEKRIEKCIRHQNRSESLHTCHWTLRGVARLACQYASLSPSLMSFYVKGIIANTFFAPDLNTSFPYWGARANTDPRFFNGQPIWFTNEYQGGRSGCVGWFACEVPDRQVNERLLFT